MNVLRTWVGELDLSKSGRTITVDVSQYSVGSLSYEARYGATIGSWEATVKAAGPQQTPRDFDTAIKFTSAIPRLGEIDLTGTDELVISNSVVTGASGTVDVYFVGKADF